MSYPLPYLRITRCTMRIQSEHDVTVLYSGKKRIVVTTMLRVMINNHCICRNVIGGVVIGIRHIKLGRLYPSECGLQNGLDYNCRIHPHRSQKRFVKRNGIRGRYDHARQTLHILSKLPANQVVACWRCNAQYGPIIIQNRQAFYRTGLFCRYAICRIKAQKEKQDTQWCSHYSGFNTGAHCFCVFVFSYPPGQNIFFGFPLLNALNDIRSLLRQANRLPPKRLSGVCFQQTGFTERINKSLSHRLSAVKSSPPPFLILKYPKTGFCFL